MTFVVTTKNGAGEKFPLRGTIWSFSMDYAQHFPSREAAQAALEKARKFISRATYRAAVIEEVA